MTAHHSAVVVDPKRGDREQVTAVLAGELGFRHVYEASDAREAVELVQQNGVGWVYSAWRLGRGNAGELFRALVRHRGVRPQPWILLSDEDNDRARSMADRLQASDYVTKPLHPQALVRATRRVCTLLGAGCGSSGRPFDCRLDLGFDPYNVYRAELARIDMAGCVLRTPVLKHGVGEVGDIGTLSIACPQQEAHLHLHGRISRCSAAGAARSGCVRTELTFTFDRVAPENLERLARLVARAAETG